jgi:hypothetical protein
VQEHKAVRRLVKSPPELWAQCSDPTSLARHLNGFGEIRITRLEPESTVAWEGESVSGTVTLEASGWGTRVQLTADAPRAPAPDSGPPATTAFTEHPQSTKHAQSGPAPVSRGLPARFGTLIRRRRESPVLAPAPADQRQAQARPAPAAPGGTDLGAELEAALDSLGAAHHRPYSRS